MKYVRQCAKTVQNRLITQKVKGVSYSEPFFFKRNENSPLESERKKAYDKKELKVKVDSMTEYNEKTKTQNGGCGTLLAGFLIFIFIIGFVVYRGGYLDGKLEELGLADVADEQEVHPSEEKLDKNTAVEVAVGQDFTEYVDYDNGTLIKFKTGETGRYYIKTSMTDLDLSMQLYKYKPEGNDLISGMISDGDGAGNYELELSGTRVLEGNTQYYAYFDWRSDCGVNRISMEFEPLEVVELDENLIKELKAVTLSEGVPYEGPFLVGEENWFYVEMDKEGSPVFDLTYATGHRGGKNNADVFLYAQQSDGTLTMIGNNSITTDMEHGTIHRHAPVVGGLPLTNPYFVSIYMETDLELENVNMTISGKLTFN